MISTIRARNVLAGLVLALATPLAPAFADVPTALNLVDSARDFPERGRAYPDMDERYVRAGNERPLTQVRSVAKGQDKRALVGALGQPVSAYGDGSWNFNVSLRLEDENRLICQYRVWFDENERVVGSVWRRPQCAALVIGRTE